MCEEGGEGEGEADPVRIPKICSMYLKLLELFFILCAKQIFGQQAARKQRKSSSSSMHGGGGQERLSGRRTGQT